VSGNRRKRTTVKMDRRAGELLDALADAISDPRVLLPLCQQLLIEAQAIRVEHEALRRALVMPVPVNFWATAVQMTAMDVRLQRLERVLAVAVTEFAALELSAAPDAPATIN
jgi:hypothetical protein